MVGAGDNGSIPDGTGDVLGYHELLERVPAIVYVADPGESGRWYYASPRILVCEMARPIGPVRCWVKASASALR